MWYYHYILKHPKTTVAAILVVTLFFAWQAKDVEVNNSLYELLPENHPSVIQDEEIKHEFNSREMILIGVINNQGVFNSATLQKVKDISDKIWEVTTADASDSSRLDSWSSELDPDYREKIDEILQNGLDRQDRGPVNNLLIEAKDDPSIPGDFIGFLGLLRLKLSPISDVISLSEIENITSTDWGLDVTPPMETVPGSQEGINKLAATVFANEMFVNGIVSEDSTGTLILAELAFYYDDHLDIAYDVFEKLENLARPFRGPERVLLAGVPMVNVYTINYMSGDMAKLTPLVILLVMLIMYLSFRMFKATFIPIAIVLLALTWTLGVMALVGRPITLIVAFMPVMIIAIGIADGIHLITEYKLSWNELKKRDGAILKTFRQLSWPVVITSLTTMAGFASLATSSLRSIRDFGIYTSIGVFAAMVISLTFVPAVLRLLSPPREVASRRRHDHRWVSAGLPALSRLAVGKRRWIYVGILLLAAVSIIGIAKIRVGSTMVGMFHEDSEIFQASKMLNEKFGGTEVMNIVIDTKQENGLKEPTVLQAVASLQDTLESLPLVGYTTSFADYIKRTNFVMNDNNPSFNRIPDSIEYMNTSADAAQNYEGSDITTSKPIIGRNQIAQYTLLYENAGGDDLEKLVDFDYSKLNVITMIRDDFTPRIKEILQSSQSFLASRLAQGAAVIYAGCATLCVVGDDLIIPSQLKSLGIALIVVLLLLILIFRSFKMGLIALMPIVVTVLVVFTIIGLFGFYLDAVMALIASIVLGIGIDYSVHFISRYQSLRKEGADANDAIRQTMATSGRAIVFNSAAVAVGFVVLLFSSFIPVQNMGWMVSANMLLSALLTLVLVPAVLSSAYKLTTRKELEQ